MGYGMGFPADGLENHGWKLYITSLVMIIASGLFVTARCVTRIRASKFGRDDAAMLLSLVGEIIYTQAGRPSAKETDILRRRSRFPSRSACNWP